jgi:two-component system nitrate/nitrite response regulator NarL
LTVVRTSAPPHTDPVRQATVAIVDDHEVFAQALSLRLDQEPDLRVVAITTSPTRVLGLVADHRPEVLVMDVELDTANGLDISAEVLDGPWRPAIVVLTCRDDQLTAATALRIGVSAVVVKLGPIEDLVTAIRAVLKGEAWASPSLVSGLVAEMHGRSAAPDEGGIDGLTGRELEVLTLMVSGRRYGEIAAELGLSVNTVRTHAHNLQKKLGVHSRVGAVAAGLRAGLRPGHPSALRTEITT